MLWVNNKFKPEVTKMDFKKLLIRTNFKWKKIKLFINFFMKEKAIYC